MSPSTPTPRLHVRGLTHAFGDRTVLRGLDLDVAPGEVVGLLGPNGSGKSTALAVLAGLLPRDATKSTVALDGRTVDRADPAYRARLGVVFQQPSVDKRLTARENLVLALSMHGVRGADARRRAAEQLEAAGLSDRADETLEKFSGGMRRRVDLARATAHRPSLLLLDEPSSGLDEASFRGLWDRILQLRQREGTSIVVATHRADEAARCDRLVVLNEGTVIARDTPENLVAGLAQDVVVLRVVAVDDAAAIAAELETALELKSSVDGREVSVACEHGPQTLVRVVEHFPSGSFVEIALRRPSLSDVFMALSGASLHAEDERAVA